MVIFSTPWTWQTPVVRIMKTAAWQPWCSMTIPASTRLKWMKQEPLWASDKNGCGKPNREPPCSPLPAFTSYHRASLMTSPPTALSISSMSTCLVPPGAWTSAVIAPPATTGATSAHRRTTTAFTGTYTNTAADPQGSRRTGRSHPADHRLAPAATSTDMCQWEATYASAATAASPTRSSGTTCPSRIISPCATALSAMGHA